MQRLVAKQKSRVKARDLATGGAGADWDCCVKRQCALADFGEGPRTPRQPSFCRTGAWVGLVRGSVRSWPGRLISRSPTFVVRTILRPIVWPVRRPANAGKWYNAQAGPEKDPHDKARSADISLKLSRNNAAPSYPNQPNQR